MYAVISINIKIKQKLNEINLQKYIKIIMIALLSTTLTMLTTHDIVMLSRQGINSKMLQWRECGFPSLSTICDNIPENTRRCAIVGLMLGQRRRRWYDIQ